MARIHDDKQFVRLDILQMRAPLLAGNALRYVGFLPFRSRLIIRRHKIVFPSVCVRNSVSRQKQNEHIVFFYVRNVVVKQHGNARLGNRSVPQFDVLRPHLRIKAAGIGFKGMHKVVGIAHRRGKIFFFRQIWKFIAGYRTQPQTRRHAVFAPFRFKVSFCRVRTAFFPIIFVECSRVYFMIACRQFLFKSK